MSSPAALPYNRFPARPGHCVRRFALCGALLVEIAHALLFARSAKAVEDIWTGNSFSSNWSTNLNWLDGSAPPAGGAADLSLLFRSSDIGRFAINDLGSPFTLNRLTLEARAVPVQIGSATGNSLRFDGPDPRIITTGTGDPQIFSPFVISSPSLTISSSGPGSLTIHGPISESGGPRQLVINSAPPTPNTQILTLSGANPFTGGVTLESGNLSIGSAQGVGVGRVTVNSGTVRLDSTVSNEFILNHDLVIVHTAGNDFSGRISSGTAGTGLTLRSAATILPLTSPSLYTGATIIDYALDPAKVFIGVDQPAGTITLGAAGSIRGSSDIHVRAGGTLTLLTSASGVVDRVNDSTPVTLRNGTLGFVSTGDTLEQTERIGAIRGAGYSTVRVTAPKILSPLRLLAASLERLERGTFFFEKTHLGDPGATYTGEIFFDTPPALTGGGGTQVSKPILPYAAMVDGNFGFVTFATYDGARGVVPLTSSDYATSLTAGAFANVRVPPGTTNNLQVTVNSLVSDQGTIFGTGTIAIASGGLISRSSGELRIENQLSFDTVEANIITVDVLGRGGLRIAGAISGSGGLTKSGTGRLVLSGTNTFTGPLTLNSGILALTKPEALGPDTSPIIINGSGAGLGTVSSPVTIGRDVELRTGIGRLEVAEGDLTLAATISGEGGLHLTRTSQTGTITLAGENTYTGPTFLATDVVIANDRAFGSGGEIVFGSKAVNLAGDWITNRPMAFTGSPTIDTGRFSATFGGVLRERGSIDKRGAGRLSITGESPYTGQFLVQGGVLEIKDAGVTRSRDVRVFRGAAFVLENGSTYVSERVAPGAHITVEAGDFRIHGNSAVAVNHRLGELRGLAGFVTLMAPAAANTLQFAIRHEPLFEGASVVIRGDNLGGGPTGAFSRVTFLTLPATTRRLISGVYADELKDGLGSSFAVLDTSSDQAGQIGVRPLRLTEYAAGSVISNPANGGSTAIDANFQATGTVATAGSSNSLNSLTLSPGAKVSLDPTQTLTVAKPGLLARAGGPASSIHGGTVAFANERATFFTPGDLAVSSLVTGSSLVKLGPGTLTLGDIAVGGEIQVQAGEARLNGAINDPGSGFSSRLSVSGGATLSGTATTTRTITVFGTVAPGDGVGALRTGPLIFREGSALQIELASPSIYSRLISSGDVSLARPVELKLSLVDGYDPIDDVESFLIIAAGGTRGSGSTFTVGGKELPQNGILTANGQSFRINYFGGDGNDIVLFAIPEPASALLFGIGVSFVVSGRRRR